MAEISIIVPVYNAAAYLRKSLDSIVNQSYRDIEFIFVDDGSGDDSPAILKEYEAADRRVTVFHQENRGAGAARNYGMGAAGGKYLLFLDCDDIFETSMVEKMHSRAEADNLDVLVCRADLFDCVTGKVSDVSWSVRREYLPSQPVIASTDIRENFFEVFVWWPWDKLYRKKFLDEVNLRFQELRSTEDLFFVCAAVLMAKRISVLDEVLVHHRTGDKNSVSNSREKSWDNFLCALEALETFLRDKGLYDRFRRDFINYVLNFSLWHLNTLTGDSYCSLYDALRNTWFKKFGVASQNKEFWYNSSSYDRMREIMEKDLKHDLLDKIHELQRNSAVLAAENEKITRMNESYAEEITRVNEKCASEITQLNEKYITEITRLNEKHAEENRSLAAERDTLISVNSALVNSRSFRIGRGITYLPRKLRDTFLK